jgi:hypothetical protein
VSKSLVGPERREAISSKDVERREDALTGEMGGQLKGCLSRRRVDGSDGRDGRWTNSKNVECQEDVLMKMRW